MKLSDSRRLIISLISLLLLIIHWVWPSLAFDTATIALIFIGLLPWLIEHIKSFEALGVKVETRDLSKASGKVLGRKVSEKADLAKAAAGGKVVLTGVGNALINLITPKMLSARESFPPQEQDSKLHLLILGVEVEKRLIALASRHEIGVREPGAILGGLIARGVLSQAEAEGLSEILLTRNLAVHGATVEPSVSEWVEADGRKILEFLDKK